jgi:hypothetical protein
MLQRQNFVSNFRRFILGESEHVANKAEIGYTQKKPDIGYILHVDPLLAMYRTRKKPDIGYIIHVDPLLVMYRTHTQSCDAQGIHGGMFEDVPQRLTHLIADKFLKEENIFNIHKHL